MPSITFNRWDLGIDLRKGAVVSDANRLRDCKNAFITTGMAVQKRPGVVKVATLEPGTKGLFAAFGKLHFAIVNSLRAILYASAGADFAQAARQVALATHDTLRAAQQAVLQGA